MEVEVNWMERTGWPLCKYLVMYIPIPLSMLGMLDERLCSLCLCKAKRCAHFEGGGMGMALPRLMDIVRPLLSRPFFLVTYCLSLDKD